MLLRMLRCATVARCRGTQIAVDPPGSELQPASDRIDGREVPLGAYVFEAASAPTLYESHKDNAFPRVFSKLTPQLESLDIKLL